MRRAPSSWRAARGSLSTRPPSRNSFGVASRGGRPEGAAHQGDPDYRRFLIRTRPVYVRAEGFAEFSRPAVLRDFPAAALDAGGE